MVGHKFLTCNQLILLLSSYCLMYDLYNWPYNSSKHLFPFAPIIFILRVSLNYLSGWIFTNVLLIKSKFDRTTVPTTQI